MEYTSLILENAVNELAKLPGVGQRTALRFALHLLKILKNLQGLLLKKQKMLLLKN